MLVKKNLLFNLMCELFHNIVYRQEFVNCFMVIQEVRTSYMKVLFFSLVSNCDISARCILSATMST